MEFLCWSSCPRLPILGTKKVHPLGFLPIVQHHVPIDFYIFIAWHMQMLCNMSFMHPAEHKQRYQRIYVKPSLILFEIFKRAWNLRGSMQFLNFPSLFQICHSISRITGTSHHLLWAMQRDFIGPAAFFSGVSRTKAAWVAGFCHGWWCKRGWVFGYGSGGRIGIEIKSESGPIFSDGLSSNMGQLC